MTLKEIEQMIASIGLPYVYYSFPEKQAPNLPYVIYYYPNSANFSADDVVYKKVFALNVELYTREKDFLYEEQVEAVLDLNNLVWDKSEAYLNSENMYEVLYQTEIFIDGE